MCKIAFLYPGQGAQQAGMGADFYENGSLAKSFLDKAEGCLDFHLKEVCFRKDERLNKTEYTAGYGFSVPRDDAGADGAGREAGYNGRIESWGICGSGGGRGF